MTLDTRIALALLAELVAADREACRRLITEGWGSDEEYVAWRRSLGLQ